jgi:hypothetical protein
MGALTRIVFSSGPLHQLVVYYASSLPDQSTNLKVLGETSGLGLFGI